MKGEVMPTLEEEWAKYVAPFIKEPGCIIRDPVVAAICLTASRWIEAMGHGHYSFSDPKRHIRMFRKAVLEECAKIAEEEMVDAEDTGHAADIAYNDACRDIAKRIRES